MATLNFMLGGALLFVLLNCSYGKVITDDADLEEELLETILKKLVEKEETKEAEASKSKDETRIIGGIDLKDGDHPWLVSLTAEIPTKTFLGITISSTKMHCGGTLIKRRWILTAAHCFVNEKIGAKARDPKYWTARLGDVDRESGFFEGIADFFGDIIHYDKWRTWEIEGEKLIIYPGYDADDHWKNDIALMRLKEAVPLEEVLVGQVSLPAQGDSLYPMPGESCLAIGWGCKKEGQKVADVAQKVQLVSLSPERCRSIWGVGMETRLCAGEVNLNKGICSGDSGGPLMCKRNEIWYQAGISSFAHAKKPGDYPGVFTRVSSYRSWIEVNTDDKP